MAGSREEGAARPAHTVVEQLATLRVEARATLSAAQQPTYQQLIKDGSLHRVLPAIEVDLARPAVSGSQVG